MPELPEVETTVRGINRKLKGKKIISVWTDYKSPYFKGKENIKDPKFFREFKKRVEGKKILSAKRRAKNILINLEGGETILVHMKMTGHFMFGKYQFNKKIKEWEPVGGYWDRKERLRLERQGIDPEKIDSVYSNPLADPFNKFIHFVIELDGKDFLCLSDMRKFAKVTVMKTEDVEKKEFSKTGPEPLDPKLTFENFYKLFSDKFKSKKTAKIKTVLMDPEIIAGVGNIYSDEILWDVGVHPESLISKIPKVKYKEIYQSTKKILSKSIKLGGDSMSDYRNIEGKRGGFQDHHNCYKKEGTKCKKIRCRGIIDKKQVGGRVGRFCSEHQKLYR